MIAYDCETAPDYSMGSFTASTVPGCRLPHFWLKDGRSLYDALGPVYTLLRLDNSTPVQVLVEAAKLHGLPLQVLDVAGETVPAEYRHALVLARGDGHIAWRGDGLNAVQAQALVQRLRGLG